MPYIRQSPMFSFMANTTETNTGPLTVLDWAEQTSRKDRGWKLDRVTLGNTGAILLYYFTGPSRGVYIRIEDGGTITTTGSWKAGRHPHDGVCKDHVTYDFRAPHYTLGTLASRTGFRDLQNEMARLSSYDAALIRCVQGMQCPYQAGGDHTCELATPDEE